MSGNFNGGPECGAVHHLEKGEVGPTFIEDGEPVSSKVKKSRLSFPMIDVGESVYKGTMIVMVVKIKMEITMRHQILHRQRL